MELTLQEALERDTIYDTSVGIDDEYRTQIIDRLRVFQKPTINLWHQELWLL